MTSRQILNQTDLMVKNEDLSDRELDLLNLIRDLNTRLDEVQSKLESRISTVQDDILRIQKQTDGIWDHILPASSKGVPVVLAKWSSQPPEGSDQ